MVSSERHKRQDQAPAGPCLRLRGLAVAALMWGLAGPAHGETRWDLPLSSSGPSVPARQLRSLRDAAANLSGNELQINVHDAGRLMPPAEIKDAVRRGVVPVGEVTLALYSGESPIYGLDTVPFLAMSFAEARRLYMLQKPLLEKRLGDEGLVLLASIPFAPLGLTARKPVTQVSDLAGLRIRAYNGLTKRMALRSGGEAVPVETAELAQAFKAGLVDAFTASPEQALARKAAKYAPFYHKLNVWIPRNALVANKAAYDAMTDSERKALLQAAAWAEEQGWQQAEAETGQLEDRLATSGFSVIIPAADFMTGVREIGRQIATDWLKDLGEDGITLLDRFYKEAASTAR